jgi:tripartite-type tricarboxylate transporter receptor subunit TctC
MEHVIYKETSQLYQGVANGELTFALGSLGTAGPLVRGGKLRFLAVAAPSRIAGFENVPTVSNRAAPRTSQPSAGTPWPCAPAPAAVVEKIRTDVRQALTGQDVKESSQPSATSPSTPRPPNSRPSWLPRASALAMSSRRPVWLWTDPSSNR